jgi:hypothetical protein
MMKQTKELSDILKKEGYESIDDFIEANLHYLPKEKQEMYRMLSGINESILNNKFRKNIDPTDNEKNKLHR